MAHLWAHLADGWVVLPLERTPVTFAALGAAIDAQGAPLPAGQFVRSGADREEWHLVSRPASAITVNGTPLHTGLRTLADRDEVGVPGLGALFFSAERLARVEPLPDVGREVACPRCRQRIAPGTPAVRCPGCDLWHHQGGELSCWTYAATCAMCGQATAEGTGFRWTPEECGS